MAKKQTSIQTRPKSKLQALKDYLDTPETVNRLEVMLGRAAGTFSNSIINAFNSDSNLQKCTTESIMESALKAASVNLPIEPALGFAAIVPYGDKAQFQLMYRGLIQLCIRSGRYERLHDTEVYQDELKSYDPITGKVEFNPADTYKMRYRGDIKNVVGYYFYFKLLTGFEKELYMTVDEVMAHALKFSKAYQNDLAKKKKSSPWSTDPISMGRKTVIKASLSRYGIMSVEMQEALVADFADTTFDQTQAAVDETVKNQMGRKTIDANFEPENKNPTDPEIPEDDFMSDEGLK